MADSVIVWLTILVLCTNSFVADCCRCRRESICKVLKEMQRMRKEFQDLKKCDEQCRNCLPNNDTTPGIPTLVRVLHGNTSVTALELLYQELFVLRRTVDRVSVYDTTTFRLKRQIPVPGLGEASWGMAACNINNYLYISDHWNHQVHVIDLSDDSVAARWNVGDRPGGLSVTSNRNVLVAYTWIKKVEEYTPTGILVKELALNNMISSAVERDADTWLVSSQWPSHSVTALRKDGQVIASFGDQPGSAEVQLNRPTAMAVDKKSGIVAVADSNNYRVIFINSSLTTARVFPFPANVASLTFPVPLCMNFPMGRLYVGEHDSQKRILIFDNVTNIDAMFK